MKKLSKIKQLGMVCWIGHTRRWKISAIPRMSRNNVLLDGVFWPTRTPSTEYGVFVDILEMTPTFTSRLACPWWHPWQDWMIFDTVCKLRHVQSFINLFWPRKLQKIQNLSKIRTTWHGALNCSYKPLKNIGFIPGMSRNNVFQMEHFGLCMCFLNFVRSL